MPDRWTWVMRRRLSRRSQLVWARSGAKNQIHAVLMRQLVGRPPFADLFGVKGRRWLSELQLAPEESETVSAAVRQVEFFEKEIAEVEQLIARAAMESAQIKRLMSVPGVNVIVAASFMAAIGNIHRFESPRKLVGYLGLDPTISHTGRSYKTRLSAPLPIARGRKPGASRTPSQLRAKTNPHEAICRPTRSIRDQSDGRNSRKMRPKT